MKMLAEDFDNNATDKGKPAPDKITDSVNQMSLNDVKKYLNKPENTCIIDREGFIACGPIVGVERPSTPIILHKPTLEEINKQKGPTKLDVLPGDVLRLPGKLKELPGDVLNNHENLVKPNKPWATHY
jgi:hypothetical protein